MAWTEERVSVLTRLWSEGLSASQIARQLGDVTRNAVIGKVHRLGLSGRATPSRSERPRVTTRKKRAPKPIIVIPETVKEAVLADGNYVTVRTLKEGMCKWPYGDPSSSEFHFCGQGAEANAPYCAAHSAVAYQPAGARRQKPATLAPAAIVSPDIAAQASAASSAKVTPMKSAAPQPSAEQGQGFDEAATALKRATA